MTEFLIVSLRCQELVVRNSEALISKLLKYRLAKLYLMFIIAYLYLALTIYIRCHAKYTECFAFFNPYNALRYYVCHYLFIIGEETGVQKV